MEIDTESKKGFLLFGYFCSDASLTVFFKVSACINNLKHMALDMNNEISTQNGVMDRLNGKVQSNKDRISAANKRAITLLK